MSTLAATADHSSELDNFIDFLFSGLQGYVYLAAKVPPKTPEEAPKWLQEFFTYPTQKPELIKAIEGANNKVDVYLGPVVYKQARAQREDVLASNVVWTEFDGNAPSEEHWEGFGKPSYLIQSSLAGHHHVYWRLTEPLHGPDAIEEITRSITYNFQADGSAWDATQILRPPGTINHKRGALVKVLDASGTVYDADLFEQLPPPPAGVDPGQWSISALPELDTVLLQYALGPDLIRLLKLSKSDAQGSNEGRSARLMETAYACAQIGMTDNEIFVILLSLDDKWEKFKHRKDREKRLAHIITVARNKYPSLSGADNSDGQDDPFVLAWDYKSFMAADIEINWVVEPMLMDRGTMLMAGPSNVGKTQVSLQFMKHIALGKDYMHYKIPVAKRVLFLSLEMGHPDLKYFMEQQDKDLNDEERDLLARNLTIVPHGEAWPLNTTIGQAQLVQMAQQFKPDIVFVDSIGSAILGDISKTTDVQPFLNFNDRFKKEFNCSTWYIHHTRKAGPGQNQGAFDNDDVYGDQYLVNRATSVYLVVKGKEGSIRIKNPKNRLAKLEKDFWVMRTENLNFIKINEGIDDQTNNLPASLQAVVDNVIKDKPDTQSAGGLEL